MKTTTKVIAAVLAVLMLSVVFAGAAAAVDTVYVYKDYKYEDYNSTWVSASGDEITFSEFQREDGKVNTSLVSDVIKEGLYTQGKETINVKYPYASVAIFAFYNGTAVVTPIAEELGLKADHNPKLVTKFSNYDSIEPGSVYNNTTSLYFVIGNDSQLPVSGLVFTSPSGDESMFLGVNNLLTATFFGDTGNNSKKAGKLINSTKNKAGEGLEEGVWNVRTVFNKETIGEGWHMPYNGNYYYSPVSHNYPFTVGKGKYTIDAEKEEVIQGSNIVLTITGPKNGVLVIDAPKTTATNSLDVEIGSGKISKINNVPIGTVATEYKPITFTGSEDNVTFIISKSGATTTVTFKTNANTELGDYVFKIGSKSVTVKVVKGKVTLNIDTPVVYAGNKMTVSGTATGSEYVYIYIKGQNVPWQKVSIIDSNTKSQKKGTYLDKVKVDKDGNFKKSFTLANNYTAANEYTIGVSSTALGVKKAGPEVVLGDNELAEADFKLKRPFFTLDPIADNIAKGSKVLVSGTVEGNPKELQFWIFGANKVDFGTIEVKDGKYSKEIETKGYDSGHYFIILQHPMVDKKFNVNLSDDKKEVQVYKTNKEGVLSSDGVVKYDISGKDSEYASNSVIDAISKQDIDDMSLQANFELKAPFLSMDAISDVQKGSNFVIKGTTNLEAGKDIKVKISSTGISGYESKPKEDQSESESASAGFEKKVTIVAGEQINTWEIELSSENLDADTTYTAQATGKVGDEEVSGPTDQFKVVAAEVKPTAEPTQPAQPTQPAEPTPASPGFGALIALAGLGAVALLVLRRK